MLACQILIALNVFLTSSAHAWFLFKGHLSWLTIHVAGRQCSPKKLATSLFNFQFLLYSTGNNIKNEMHLRKTKKMKFHCRTSCCYNYAPLYQPPLQYFFRLKDWSIYGEKVVELNFLVSMATVTKYKTMSVAICFSVTLLENILLAVVILKCIYHLWVFSYLEST